MDMKATRLRRALDALYYSGAYRVMAPIARGCGAIFMLHRVLPGANGTKANAFDPNGFLAVSPEFLDQAIGRVKKAGFDLVDMDEAVRRLTSGDTARFACFTADDGYRDNRDHALEVFERHNCPLTVYVSSGFAARTTAPWWVMIERLIAARDDLMVEMDGKSQVFSCVSVDEKYHAYEWIAGEFSKASGPVFDKAIEDLCRRYGLNQASLSEELTMDWQELAEFASHPLVTLGAHTVSHPVLANLDKKICAAEITDGADAMAHYLGERPTHFAYPYGHDWAAGQREFDLARKLGFASGVVTRKGVLYPEHSAHMTALPRVSLNGDYQSERYVDVLISGAAFALFNKFRRVNAA